MHQEEYVSLRRRFPRKREKGFREQYEEKKRAVSDGMNPGLYIGEFIQFLLDKQGISSLEFSEKLGYTGDYFKYSVFNSRSNTGAGVYNPFRQKMAAITNTEPKFWDHMIYFPSAADNITIDMEKDISDVVTKYAHFANGGFARSDARHR